MRGGDVVTRWTVEATGDDKLGMGRTYSVVKVVDGRREIVRARWVGLSCIDAQVIAAELQRAYWEGWEDGRTDLRQAVGNLGDSDA